MHRLALTTIVLILLVWFFGVASNRERQLRTELAGVKSQLQATNQRIDELKAGSLPRISESFFEGGR